MGGGYIHLTDSDNNFIGTDTIENLGDASEALEECYEIIKELSGGSKEAIYEAAKRAHSRGFPDCTLGSFEEYWRY